MMQINTILLTTDLSEVSRRAFEPAMTIAEKFGAKVIVAHIEDDHYLSMVSDHVAVSLDAERVWEMQHELSKTRLGEFMDTHAAENVEVVREVRRGIPHLEIVRLAEERHTDLIVMATHGRGFISHAFMGSTTERVIRAAPCPVLAVRSSARG